MTEENMAAARTQALMKMTPIKKLYQVQQLWKRLYNGLDGAECGKAYRIFIICWTLSSGKLRPDLFIKLADLVLTAFDVSTLQWTMQTLPFFQFVVNHAIICKNPAFVISLIDAIGTEDEFFRALWRPNTNTPENITICKKLYDRYTSPSENHFLVVKLMVYLSFPQYCGPIFLDLCLFSGKADVCNAFVCLNLILYNLTASTVEKNEAKKLLGKLLTTTRSKRRMLTKFTKKYVGSPNLLYMLSEITLPHYVDNPSNADDANSTENTVNGTLTTDPDHILPTAEDFGQC